MTEELKHRGYSCHRCGKQIEKDSQV